MTGQPQVVRQPIQSKFNDKIHRYVLYILTLLLEALGAVARYYFVLILFLPFYILTFVTAAINIFRQVATAVQSSQNSGGVDPGIALQNAFVSLNSIARPVGLVVAVVPLVFSILTMIGLPGGFLLSYYALGARRPSRREWERIQEAYKEFKQVNPKLRLPTGTFVLDESKPNAYIIGSTCYVTRGLVNDGQGNSSGYLMPLLAHNLGHLNSSDGQLVLALRHLVLPPVYFLSRGVGLIAPGVTKTGSMIAGEVGGCLVGGIVWLASLFLSLAGGGFGEWLLSPFWVSYWRMRDYEADHVAASLGEGDALIEYLQRNQIFDVPVPYLGPVAPYTELRIDRLLPGGQVAAEEERSEAWLRLKILSGIVGAVLGVLVLILAFNTYIKNSRYSVTNTTWQLTNVCSRRGCASSDDGALEAGQLYLLTFTDNTFEFTKTSENGSVFPRSEEGAFSYLEDNTIVFSVAKNDLGGDALGGRFTVEKSGGKLTLQGNSGTYIFSDLNSAAEPTIVSTLAAQSVPPVIPAPTLQSAVSTQETQIKPSAMPTQVEQPAPSQVPTEAAQLSQTAVPTEQGAIVPSGGQLIVPGETAQPSQIDISNHLVGTWVNNNPNRTPLTFADDGRFCYCGSHEQQPILGTWKFTDDTHIQIEMPDASKNFTAEFRIADDILTLIFENGEASAWRREK